MPKTQFFPLFLKRYLPSLGESPPRFRDLVFGISDLHEIIISADELGSSPELLEGFMNPVFPLGLIGGFLCSFDI